MVVGERRKGKEEEEVRCMYEVHSPTYGGSLKRFPPLNIHTTCCCLWLGVNTSWLVSGCVCRKLLLERCLDIERLETLKMDDDYLL